jgi:hypothetical protein
MTWKRQQSARRANNVDEYYRYIREPPVPHSHIQQGVYTWWLEEHQQLLYPNLSRMALDILTIPALSAAPERLFLQQISRYQIVVIGYIVMLQRLLSALSHGGSLRVVVMLY